MKRIIPYFIVSSCLLFACNTDNANTGTNVEPDTEPIAPVADESGKAIDSIEATNITTTNNPQAILGTFGFGDCTSHVEKDFDCSCSFGPTGDPKEQNLFLSDWNESACVKVKGQLNALYSDWEERDYKAELKKLSESEVWITVNGNAVSYFGKPLTDYKYEDPIEFLTDVILASGKEIDLIPIQTTTGGDTFEQAQADSKAAVAKAKEYISKGGKDPLSIYKYDNRTYDVFVRMRQLTQYEGEANKYEGKMTLLPHRGNEIMETRTIKGTCGC